MSLHVLIRSHGHCPLGQMPAVCYATVCCMAAPIAYGRLFSLSIGLLVAVHDFNYKDD